MSDEVLFKSAADALRFAFNFSHQQYDRPLMNRLADKRLGGGKGLVGPDGAGQAGMIQRRLEDLPNLHRAILFARFLPRTSPCACGSLCCSSQRKNLVWEEAASAIGAYATEAIPDGAGRYRLRTALVRRFYGAKDTQAKIADDVGVSLRTVQKESALVANWLRGTKASKSGPGVPGVDAVAMAAAAALMDEMGFLT